MENIFNSKGLNKNNQNALSRKTIFIDYYLLKFGAGIDNNLAEDTFRNTLLFVSQKIDISK